MCKDFGACKKRGDQGETFFERYCGHLISATFIGTRQNRSEEWKEYARLAKDKNEKRKYQLNARFFHKIEGMDFYGLILNCSPIQGENEQQEKKIEAKLGTVEVKTIGSMTLINRDDVGEEKSGDIPFEMWRKAGSKEWGSLPAMSNPEAFNSAQNEKEKKRQADDALGVPNTIRYPDDVRAVKPDILGFIFCKDPMCQEPFAAVIFEDFKKLEARLKEVKKKLKAEGRFLIIQNVWHVPFDLISDLATVTMINDEPMLYSKPGCSVEVQKERLEYVKNAAKGRHLDTKKVDEDMALVEAMDKARRNSV